MNYDKQISAAKKSVSDFIDGKTSEALNTIQKIYDEALVKCKLT